MGFVEGVLQGSSPLLLVWKGGGLTQNQQLHQAKGFRIEDGEKWPGLVGQICWSKVQGGMGLRGDYPATI